MLLTHRSIVLDLLRWASAFLVLIGHLRSILFLDFSSTIDTLPLKVFYFITGFGHEAVVVFFVLSGYLVGGSVVSLFKNSEFNLKEYLLKRFIRLYTVLIVALILTVVFDRIGRNFQTIPIYEGDVGITSLQPDPLSRLDVDHFINSLLMLQNIYLPPLGSNGPLWSLANEFWYYLLFPGICGVYFFKADALKCSIYLTAVLTLMSFLPPSLLIYMLVWLAGLVPHFVTFPYKWCRNTLTMTLLATLGYARFGLQTNQFVLDLIFAIQISLLLATINNIDKVKARHPWNKFLASLSYSLYLTHYPYILCFVTLMNFHFSISIKTLPSPITIFLFVSAVATSYLLAYFTAYLTEFRTEKIRSYLLRR